MSKNYKIVMFQGPLTLSVGKYKFSRGKEVQSSDPALIKELEYNPNFKVEEIAAKPEAKAPAAPASSPAQGAVAKAAAAVKKTLTPAAKPTAPSEK